MTTSSDLSTNIGKHRAIFLLINGLEPIFWCHSSKGTPDDWERTIKTCLEPPEELALQINLGSMVSDISAITFEIHDIPDTDGTSYFGKLFGPAKWSTSPHVRLASGTTSNSYISADDTTFNIKNPGELSGTIDSYMYIGNETILASILEDAYSITDISRGMFPAVSKSQNWGSAYHTPLSGESGYDMSVGIVPFSMIGKMVALYIITYDDENDCWNSYSDKKLLWVGRISDRIIFDGQKKMWKLSCESLIKDFDKKVGVNYPTTELLQVINLQSTPTDSRMFRIEEHYDGNQINVCYCTIPQGIFAGWRNLTAWLYSDNLGGLKDLMKETKVAIDTAINGNTTYLKSISLHIDPDDVKKPKFQAVSSSNKTKVVIRFEEWIHCLRALGVTDDIEISCSETNGTTYYGEAFAQDTAFTSYQPLQLRANGKKLYIKEPDALFENQGDCLYGHIKIKGKNPEGREQNYYYRYSSITADGYYITLADDQPYDITTSTNKGSFVGDQLDWEIPIQNIHIPWMSQNFYTNCFRGPFEMLLYFILSTGTNSLNHAAYDRLKPQMSLGIPSSLIDVPSFWDADRAIMKNPLAWRYFYPIENVSVMELIKAECQLFGFCLCWDDEKFKLKPLLPPPTDTYTQEINEDYIMNTSFQPMLDMSVNSVVNQYECRIDYSYLEDKFNAPIVVREPDSIIGVGQIKSITIEHKGITVKKCEDKLKDVLDSRLLGRILRYPMPVFEIPIAPTLMCEVFAGDVIKFVSTKCPNPLGDGTFTTSHFGLVLNKSWNYRTWVGNIKVMLLSQWASYGDPWSPSAITNKNHASGGWDAVNYRLYLLPYEFGDEETDPDDGEVFITGDVINIIERAPADPENPQKWTGLVVAKNYEADANECLTLETTTLSGFDSEKEYVITYADYDDITTLQKLKGCWYHGYAEYLGAAKDAVKRYG